MFLCLQIDIDDNLMEQCKAKAAPLAADYLSRRKQPLRIEGYHGSVDSPHECLRNTDAVICVEL